ncbi:MAG: fasciclin domain-containing protein [Prevotella sp.]|nr:fasciclin domain-containing protein [Prevotella sp.]
MITKITKKHLISLSFIICCLSFSVCVTSCVDNDDDVPMNRYTAEKMTAAQFLEENESRVSDFIALLKKTSYFAMLSTYGDYTVFAPNNEAFAKYMATNSYNSIDEIPLAVCDTLVRTHIIKTKAYFTTDISEGSLGMNMAETFIELSINTDAENNNAVVHFANKVARMVEYDDSVTNGVVHIVNNIIPRTSDKLPDVIKADPTVSIFAEALFMTGLSDSLMAYEDKSYPEWGADKASQDSAYTWNLSLKCKAEGADPIQWVQKRYFKFTAFVEPDSIYKMHGIMNVSDLEAYAKKIYDEVYPEDAGLYDKDYRNRKNPLNRFISYHLLDRVLPYDEVIMRKDCFKHWDIDKCDPEEFYETMSPGTLMRFSSFSEQLYINRKGHKANVEVPGVRVWKSTESGTSLQQAPNGMYHYLDDILAYTTEVRDVVLNCRIRFDSTVLSPDFANSDRPLYGEDKLRGYRLDYIKNWKVLGEKAVIGLHGEGVWWQHYKSNGITVSGIFDMTIKLPPVPTGTYEIRTGYTVNPERGVVQFYLNNVPCGIPADLRIYGPDPSIGWVADVTGDDAESRNANKAIDKAMHNRGYMKAMDCYWQGAAKENVLRAKENNLRYILTTQYLDSNETYYLRARQVLKDPECYWSFDYIELCPKSVYGSPEGEDTH